MVDDPAFPSLATAETWIQTHGKTLPFHCLCKFFASMMMQLLNATAHAFIACLSLKLADHTCKQAPIQ